MDTQSLVLRFLRSIGRPKEAQFYVSLFQQANPESFALLCVSEGVMRDTSEALELDLRVLSQLGLTPIIVFGLVTPQHAKQHATAIHRRLSGRIACEVCSLDQAQKAARDGKIALVPGISGDSIDARFQTLAASAARLGTRKIAFVGRKQGLMDANGQLRPFVDLKTDYAELAIDGALPQTQQALLCQVRTLVDLIPHRMTISVTNAMDLLRELFTVRGSGTLIRRGSTIAHHKSYDLIDKHRLQHLIESAFRRPLSESFFDRAISDVYIADDYRGAAIIAPSPFGGYLTKFAVEKQARGEGVGRDLWRALASPTAPLFWRSRPENPINQWYMQNCDGFVRTAPWIVFWRGLRESEIPACLKAARTFPTDLVAS